MEPLRPRQYRVAILDFDGTLSLIREGWSRIMADVGRDALTEKGVTCDSSLVDWFQEQMLRLSGRPSLVQMQKLAEELTQRGIVSPTPDQLHDEFLSRLYAQIEERKQDLKRGTVPPESWTVPGTHALLDELQRRGVTLYLVSGTDREAVEEESALLRLTDYFGPRLFAPSPAMPNFHKRDALATILGETGVSPDEIIGFGDGFSDTVEVKRIGGTAVGVASVEIGKTGYNEQKRNLLAEWGADPIIPDYAEAKKLLARLWGNG
ncbi:MAG: HAD hydrolase-like protein [Gemmataceae bacterium]